MYELEETIDELQAREQDLNNDLASADQAFESAKMHYENLVTALKEARKAVQVERDDALSSARREAEGRSADKEGWKRESKERDERHKRVLADRDQVSPFSFFPQEVRAELIRGGRYTRACKPNLRAQSTESPNAIGTSRRSNLPSGVWRTSAGNWATSTPPIDSRWNWRSRGSSGTSLGPRSISIKLGGI